LNAHQSSSALGIALSALLLWWAFKDAPIAQVLDHIRHANVWLLIAATVVGTCIFPLRARRWRTILDPVAPDLPFWMLWRATAIGMMISNVVPARAGEVARAYALTRETDRVPFTAAFASIAVDRVFDAAVILLLMFAAMLDPRLAAGATIAGRPVGNLAFGGVVFAVAVLTVLYLMVFFPALVLATYAWVARRIAPRLQERGLSHLTAFMSGLGVLRSPRRFLSVFWWTLIHWLVNAAAFYIGFLAFGIDAPFSAALFLQGIIAIGVAVPQAPGFWGTFELLGKLGLALYGVPDGLAVAWGFSYHLLSFIPITLIGAAYFIRMGIHLGDVRAASSAARSTDAHEPPAAAPAASSGR
jgi:glycosyltransferase 2 family protein